MKRGNDQEKEGQMQDQSGKDEEKQGKNKDKEGKRQEGGTETNKGKVELKTAAKAIHDRRFPLPHYHTVVSLKFNSMLIW